MVSVKTPLFSYHTLANGLRCVVRFADTSVEYCGLAIDAGSRDDGIHREGLAHFVEHTIFKGTDRRRPWHILNRMESIGGELNAYTTKEYTMLYSVFPKGHLQRAADLLADLVAYSRFPDAELCKEREVVADEIDTYLDMPSDAIFDDYEDIMFAGSALGHNILGNEKSLSAFTSQMCREYISRYYVPGNMVFFYQGPGRPDKVMAIADKYFSVLNHEDLEKGREVPPTMAPFDEVRDIASHQSHCITGVRIPGFYSPHRHALSLWTNMLGGPGMNSLLNVALREKRGLVYSVEASSQCFTDSGMFTVYFGCDSKDVSRCRRVADEVIKRTLTGPLSEKKLEAAKRQYIGQMTVSFDNSEQTALGSARAVLYHGTALSLEQMSHNIDSVTVDDMRSAADLLMSCPFSTLLMR